MSEFNCENCYSASTFNQVIYSQASASPYAKPSQLLTFTLNSFNCNNCNQSLSSNVYIDAFGTTPLVLSITNMFVNNSFYANGMIYVSQSVNLESGLLENITIVNSVSSGGGMISDNHASGKLSIKNLVSE